MCVLIFEYYGYWSTQCLYIINHPVYDIHIIIPIIGKCIKNHSECSRETIALRFVAGPVRGTKHDDDQDQEQMTCNLLIMFVPKFFISFMFTSFCTGNVTINHSSDRILYTSQKLLFGNYSYYEWTRLYIIYFGKKYIGTPRSNIKDWRQIYIRIKLLIVGRYAYIQRDPYCRWIKNRTK